MSGSGNKPWQVEKKLLRVVTYGAQNLQAKSQDFHNDRLKTYK